MDSELFGFEVEDAPKVYGFIILAASNKEKWLTDIFIYGGRKLGEALKEPFNNDILENLLKMRKK